MSARIAEVATLSPSSFRKRYRSSYETPSPSSSLTLLGDELGEEDTEEDDCSNADEERESQGLDDEGRSLDDEGQGLDEEGQGIEDEEDATPEGQQQAVLIIDTAVSEPLGLGYRVPRRRALESTKEIAPNTYEVGKRSRSVPEQEGAEGISAFRQPTFVTRIDPEDDRWSLGSLPVSLSSPVVPSPIASPVATPTTTISVDEDQFLEVGAQLELHMSILHDHTQRLDPPPPTLFEGYDKDLRELYTKSGAVRDEIFSQRYRFRSLEREQERATRENHDLRRQLAKEMRE
ncbi:hypothetical protein Tco_1136736 [Tanacetum coccineum]